MHFLPSLSSDQRKLIMHLSKYCPTYPHPGKGGDLGGDLTQLKSMPLMTGQLCRSIHCYYDW